MFGLGMPEILLILAIALIVIGPKKLPELAKTLGRAMGEFKRSAQELKRSIDVESTIKEPVKDIKPPPAKDLKEVIKDANRNEHLKEGPEKPADPSGKETPGQTPTADTGEPAQTPGTDRDASFSSDTGDSAKR